MLLLFTHCMLQVTHSCFHFVVFGIVKNAFEYYVIQARISNKQSKNKIKLYLIKLNFQLSKQ